jgi:hypothetical protein
MKPIEDSSRKTRQWSQYSLWCNLAAVLIVVTQYYTQWVWLILLVDVLVLAGLGFFFKACYECVRAKTWRAFAAFMPALVFQIAILASVGLAFWYYWSKADGAHS